MKKRQLPNPTESLLFSFIIFIIVGFAIKIGLSKYRIPSIDPISWEQFFETGLTKALWVALITLVLHYGYRTYEAINSRINGKIHSRLSTQKSSNCQEVNDEKGAKYAVDLHKDESSADTFDFFNTKLGAVVIVTLYIVTLFLCFNLN
jgi:hypothetical protein